MNNRLGASGIKLDEGTINAAIAARTAAKAEKNDAEADQIRRKLSAQGVELIDKAEGMTEWRHK